MISLVIDQSQPGVFYLQKMMNFMKPGVFYPQKNDIFHEYLEETLTEEQTFNQYIIQIFQKIDKFGYNTSIEWFTKLSIFQLRKLWINLP